MKSLIILSIVLVSFNVFSADVGEDKKGECIYSDQSKREAKLVVETPASDSDKKETVKGKTK